MKKLKLASAIIFSLLSFSSAFAQNKMLIPEKLHGFWHFEVQNKGDWDGSLIGEDYVEFFYKIYQVTEVKEKNENSYQFTLKPEEGNTITLDIDGFDGHQALLKFSDWSDPQKCTLLDYPVDTEPVAFSDMPKPLFKKWTAGDSEVAFQLHGKNQLFFNNKDWEVVSIGYYLDKEYRILVKNDEIHKFIYVLNFSDKRLSVASNLKNVSYVPLADNPDIYKILGNWAEEKSNNWRLGFFEELAICDGELYTYQSLKCKDTECNIVLENKERTIRLSLNLVSKDLCKVKMDGQKEATYFKCEKHLPAYTIADHTKFLDTEFKKMDTVTIRGYLRNNPLEKPFSAGFDDPIKQDQVEFYADVDQNGFFTLKFPLINTTQVFLDWGRMTKMDVVEPGESYFLFFDFSNQQHLILGDNERLHNELAAYEPYYPTRGMTREQYMEIRNLETMPFLKLKKQELDDCRSHLNNYIKENPSVSEKFKYYNEENYRFRIASDLMQRRFSLNRNTREQFPEGFMEYVSDTLYQNRPVNPYTLVREYLSFMRDYIGYNHDINSKATQSVSSIDGLRYMEKKGRLKLSEQDIQVISKAEEYFEILGKLRMENADSVTIAEATKPYADTGEKITELFKREDIKRFMEEEWHQIATDILAKKGIEAELASFDTLIKDPLLKEIFETQKFYWYIDYKKSGLPDDIYSMFKERIQNPVFAAQVIEPNNYYKKLANQDILYVESLKNTEHLKDAKDADSLFTALTEPYRGKVIYVDFWGSWCGPCKQQMKFVHDVKEALKGKDVIFMYFANRSPEEAWKNVIKENQLSGENAVHYRLPPEQQAMIERRLSIRAFPTYILIDKEGNVVNMSAPRPEQKAELVKEITKLLNP